MGEPCAREVVAGDTPACHGVQDPAVPGGEFHSTGVPQHRSPSTPCQTLVLLQDLSNTWNMQGGKGLLLGSPPCTPPPPQWVRVLLLGPTFCRAPLCQTKPQRGAGSGLGAVLATSYQELSSSLL